jgi:hypothetical protein
VPGDRGLERYVPLLPAQARPAPTPTTTPMSINSRRGFTGPWCNERPRNWSHHERNRLVPRNTALGRRHNPRACQHDAHGTHAAPPVSSLPESEGSAKNRERNRSWNCDLDQHLRHTDHDYRRHALDAPIFPFAYPGPKAEGRTKNLHGRERNCSFFRSSPPITLFCHGAFSPPLHSGTTTCAPPHSYGTGIVMVITHVEVQRDASGKEGRGRLGVDPYPAPLDIYFCILHVH